MMHYHLYANDREQAIALTRQEHPHAIIGEAQLDEVWQNPHRWRVEVFGTSKTLDVDAARGVGFVFATGDGAGARGLKNLNQ